MAPSCSRVSFDEFVERLPGPLRDRVLKGRVEELKLRWGSERGWDAYLEEHGEEATVDSLLGSLAVPLTKCIVNGHGVFCTGQTVQYLTPDGEADGEWKLDAIHRDDPEDLYVTISRDGTSRQTTLARIRPLHTPSTSQKEEVAEKGGGSEAQKGTVAEDAAPPQGTAKKVTFDTEPEYIDPPSVAARGRHAPQDNLPSQHTPQRQQSISPPRRAPGTQSPRKSSSAAAHYGRTPSPQRQRPSSHPFSTSPFNLASPRPSRSPSPPERSVSPLSRRWAHDRLFQHPNRFPFG